ncbi:MAG: effector protein Tle3 domain-containing protein [Achromobacter sp.]|uniref:T6SS effector phospholipase Tle3 domain-containing protein n=1 Tax=unclassified Achromobacter TaxID=2626865 RepID=UPI0006F80F70|nr:DUF3274 domain-containing protein [Achromobacter sp. Root565]KRA02717.1 hypothetical protein ASD71_12125 [Achromobacter sp. Root565]
MHSPPITGKTRAIVAPNASDAYAQKQQPKPCIVILIHGVNDLAGVYDDLETGICTGLNERLDHLFTNRGERSPAALNPARYTSPKDDDGKAPDPDAVYYRRRATAGKHGGHSRSVVIPFYWGYREEEGRITKQTPHGEWLDRFGNRLDKAGTKEGGFFANATTTLPDMFGQGFSGKVAGMPANAMFGSPDHPLFPAPSRRYMVLAAQRLAMLVRIIRAYRHPDGRAGEDDTINVVGHSQGNLITLLANAMLHDEGLRPIDGFVLMSPPYSLAETFFERSELGDSQQTAPARVKTLSNIVNFIGKKPHPTPSLADMADAGKDSCIGGLRWTGQQCETSVDGNAVTFAERDNRGGVFLYFSPQDQTVGMANVQGIGWQGVAEAVSYGVFDLNASTTRPYNPAYQTSSEEGGYRRVRVPALPALGDRFFQRIFTMRERDGKGEEVGKPPSHSYELVRHGERTWEGTQLGAGRTMVANADFAPGQTVTVQAPALPVPFLPDFVAGGTTLDRTGSRGVKPVWTATDPIDASISITNGGIDVHTTRVMTLSTDSLSGTALRRALEEKATDLNDPSRNPYLDPENSAWAADWHRVAHVKPLGQGRYDAVFEETPNQARRRMMDAPAGSNEAISFHSAIPMSGMHSRRAVAYDLAIGQACSIDDEVFYAYLCRVADWRLGWKKNYRDGRNGIAPNSSDVDLPNEALVALYRAENEVNRHLIDATDLYRSNREPNYDRAGSAASSGGGFLPGCALSASIPTLVESETIGDRQRSVHLAPGVSGAYR